MKLVTNKDNYKIYNGSMLDLLEVIEPNSIDSIVTDPPYELNFMNKGWDSSGIAFQKDTWKKCYTALKSGGYLLAFGGSRTFHRIAVAIEDAGFEIRDTIMWLYGSGFPKSHNIAKSIESKIITGSANTQSFHKLNGEEIDTKIGFTKMQHNQGARPNDYTDRHKSKININYKTDLAKQWQGWGTALKPAYEPIIVARKPIEKTVAENVMKYGVGGINIDECRVGFEDTQNPATNPLYRQQNKEKYKQIEKGQSSEGIIKFTSSKNDISNLGRFPANVIHDGSEDVVKGFPQKEVKVGEPYNYFGREYNNKDTSMFNGDKPKAPSNYNDSGSASRYFYQAKTSKKDREEGLEALPEGLLRRMRPDKDDNNPTGLNKEGRFAPVVRKNIHPTVKPTELMQYLVRLVSPKGATILDPFMGSGSTGKAVMFENRERNADYKFIGIDLTEEYCHISSARIDYALNKYEYDYENEVKEAEERGQLSLEL